MKMDFSEPVKRNHRGEKEREKEDGESGRRDSNSRPLGPEPSALARLRHAPIQFQRSNIGNRWSKINELLGSSCEKE